MRYVLGCDGGGGVLARARRACCAVLVVPGMIGLGLVILGADRVPDEAVARGAESRSKFVTIFSSDGEVRC